MLIPWETVPSDMWMIDIGVVDIYHGVKLSIYGGGFSCPLYGYAVSYWTLVYLRGGPCRYGISG